MKCKCAWCGEIRDCKTSMVTKLTICATCKAAVKNGTWKHPQPRLIDTTDTM